MTLTRIILFALLVGYSLSCAVADNGYRISIKIEGTIEGDVLLAYHFGDRQFLKDTARLEQAGLFVFEGQQRLDPGMYLVVLPGQKFFEVIVDKNQHFGITTKIDEFIEKTTFERSPDNEAFYEYLRFISQKSNEMSGIRQELAAESLGEARRIELNGAIKKINDAVSERQREYIERFPIGLFSRVLLAQQEPELPEAPLGPDGTPDQLFLYQLYKEKFWDNIDFKDDRLLRTPVYQNRLRTFFSNVVVQIPDSVIVQADKLIEKARANPEMFKYTVWFITNHFERSQIMGHDAVFVHMIETYYMTGQTPWVEAENLRRITERAMKLKPLLIGKVAPDIIMFRPNMSRVPLHSIKANFIVLYFWDSECSHCRRITPELRTLSERLKPQGVEVFAVNTEADAEIWLKAVESYGLASWINVNDPANLSEFREKYDLFATPVIYLLDKNKRIIAKRVTVEQVNDIIQHEMQRDAAN